MLTLKNVNPNILLTVIVILVIIVIALICLQKILNYFHINDIFR